MTTIADRANKLVLPVTRPISITQSVGALCLRAASRQPAKERSLAVQFLLLGPIHQVAAQSRSQGIRQCLPEDHFDPVLCMQRHETPENNTTSST